MTIDALALNARMRAHGRTLRRLELEARQLARWEASRARTASRGWLTYGWPQHYTVRLDYDPQEDLDRP